MERWWDQHSRLVLVALAAPLPPNPAIPSSCTRVLCALCMALPISHVHRRTEPTSSGALHVAALSARVCSITHIDIGYWPHGTAGPPIQSEEGAYDRKHSEARGDLLMLASDAASARHRLERWYVHPSCSRKDAAAFQCPKACPGICRLKLVSLMHLFQ